MQNESIGNQWFQILKGVGLALSLAFLGVVIVAATLSATPLDNSAIYPLNQTVKVVAVFVGALACVREEKGFLKGAGIGTLFTALSYLTFSAIGGDFSLSWLIVCEWLLCVGAGAIAGVIGVNKK